MTRSRLHLPTLSIFLVAALSVALIAFGLTRWLVDDAAGALPALQITPDAAAAAPGALDATKLFEARVDTVVTIQATINGQPMNGTGFVENVDGTIVTASHVIRDYEAAADATTIRVRFHSGDEVLAEVRAIDQFNDLAILSIDPAQVSGLVAAPMADSDKVLVGAEVASIGAPMGLDWTQTLGNVSATHRKLGSRINAQSDIPDLLQHDSAVNQGNSGGPVFNARGEVIGINQQITTKNGGSVGLSLAVSSNIVKRAVSVWRATGKIEYAELGLQAVDVTPQLAAAGQLGTDTGAMVQSVTGPASQAGLATGRSISHLGEEVLLGDVIVELAGRPITSSADLARVIGLLDATQSVEVTYVRGGARRTANITAIPRSIV